MTEQQAEARPKDLRVARSGMVLLLWLASAGLLWLSWPGQDLRTPLQTPAAAGAKQTRLGKAIHTSMAPHIPDLQERQVIWDWIAGPQQRDRFYARVWPILQRRCHGCHGALKRPAGALPLARLAQVLPLVRVKASARRQLWRVCAQQLPLTGGLLILFALLLSAAGPITRSSQWLLALAFAALLCHAVGAWWHLSHPAGISLAAGALLVWGACLLALGGGLLWREWRR